MNFDFDSFNLDSVLFIYHLKFIYIEIIYYDWNLNLMIINSNIFLFFYTCILLFLLFIYDSYKLCTNSSNINIYKTINFDIT